MFNIPITKYMSNWNPVSIMVLGGFCLFSFCIIWYVTSGMTPPPWIQSMGSIVLGGGTLGLGGMLATLHTQQVVEQTTANVMRVQNGNGGKSPPPPSSE